MPTTNITINRGTAGSTSYSITVTNQAETLAATIVPAYLSTTVSAAITVTGTSNAGPQGPTGPTGAASRGRSGASRAGDR